MKRAINLKLAQTGIGVAFAAFAAPAMAGSVAVCVGETEDRQGIVSHLGYMVAQSEDDSIPESTLRDEAESSLRTEYDDLSRVRCESYRGEGHYVVVGAGLEINGAVRYLYGAGFGASRASAINDSDDRLNNIVEFGIFRHAGGQTAILEEGQIGS